MDGFFHSGLAFVARWSVFGSCRVAERLREAVQSGYHSLRKLRRSELFGILPRSKETRHEFGRFSNWVSECARDCSSDGAGGPRRSDAAAGRAREVDPGE